MSSNLDLRQVSGNVEVRVEGLNRTIRALSKAGADAQEMKALMHSIGMLVVNAAVIPNRTGRLEASVRAGKGKTKAVVRAGGARVPYAGVIHYGWPARNIAPNEFLRIALQRQQQAVLSTLNAGLDDLLRKNNL